MINVKIHILFFTLVLCMFFTGKLLSQSAADTANPLVNYIVSLDQKVQDEHREIGTLDPDNISSLPIGIVQQLDDLFISTSIDIDAVLAKANGNISIIEQELGIPSGSWQGKGGIVRIDITSPENFNLRIPDGSEAGANPLWEPGGFTSGGKVEAVTDPIPSSNISAQKVIQ